jgi:hypothetical protein
LWQIFRGNSEPDGLFLAVVVCNRLAIPAWFKRYFDCSTGRIRIGHPIRAVGMTVSSVFAQQKLTFQEIRNVGAQHAAPAGKYQPEK